MASFDTPQQFPVDDSLTPRVVAGPAGKKRLVDPENPTDAWIEINERWLLTIGA
jgi:hypothetical protein